MLHIHNNHLIYITINICDLYKKKSACVSVCVCVCVCVNININNLQHYEK